jgi:uncharacterized protein (UPF0261 family)
VAGTTSQSLADAGDRGGAVEAMASGAAAMVRRLFDEGRFGAILALGGSGGSSTAAAAMRALPVGSPSSWCPSWRRETCAPTSELST